MSAISHALQTILFNIPPQVISKTFVPTDMYGYASVSVEQAILDRVIYPRVILNANIMGGQLLSLSLRQAVSRNLLSSTAIYQYDHKALHDTEIVSVLGFTYGNSLSPVAISGGIASYSESCTDGVDRVNPMAGSSLQASIGRLSGDASSLSQLGAPSYVRTRLVGKNLIAIQDVMELPSDGWFKVIASHDNELNDIQPRSYMNFSQMALHAIKSYIYNQLVITAGAAELQYGQELSAFSAVIQEYADEEELYLESVKLWQRIAYMQDPRRMHNLIGSQLNPLSFY